MYKRYVKSGWLIVKRGVAFVRNVFCFKAAEHQLGKLNNNKTRASEMPEYKRFFMTAEQENTSKGEIVTLKFDLTNFNKISESFKPKV